MSEASGAMPQAGAFASIERVNFQALANGERPRASFQTMFVHGRALSRTTDVLQVSWITYSPHWPRSHSGEGQVILNQRLLQFDHEEKELECVGKRANILGLLIIKKCPSSLFGCGTCDHNLSLSYAIVAQENCDRMPTVLRIVNKCPYIINVVY